MKRVAMVSVLVLWCSMPLLAGQWFIPAAAHVDGAAGSVWRSKLVLNNFSDGIEQVTVTLLPRGQNNANLGQRTSLFLEPGETREVDDVLWTLFAFEGAAALRVNAGSEELVVTSRTYNQAASGTYGQAIPGVTREAAIATADTAYLLGLGHNEQMRSNLGWVNLEGAPITVTVELFDGDKNRLASESFSEQPYGHTQFNVFTELFDQPVDNAYALVVASGTFVPYASVVAAGSNDPIYVSALSDLDAGSELIFTAAAHAPGAGGTNWGTDVWIYNAAFDPAVVTLELWEQGKDNSTPRTAVVSEELGIGRQMILGDVVLEVFGLDSAQGALVVRSDRQLLATSRTFNTAPEGSFGQFIAARSVGSMGGIGETQYLTGAVDSSDFRSNLGLVATANDTVVELILRGADGRILASAVKDLQANDQFQQRLSSIFGVSGFEDCTVEARMVGATGTLPVLGAYLSIVDEYTTDPTYAPAAHGIGEDPGKNNIIMAVSTISTVLGSAVAFAGPNATLPKDQFSCVDVDYSFNEVSFGESPVGQCWASSVIYDECYWEFPNLGSALAEDGLMAVDVCVIDDYPSTLEIDLTTTYSDLDSGETRTMDLDALLTLVLEYGGLLPETAQLTGKLSMVGEELRFDADVDLLWDGTLVSFAPYPVGTVHMVFPYETQGVTAEVDALATFDGSEVVRIDVRMGYWQGTFYLNLRTGQVGLP